MIELIKNLPYHDNLIKAIENRISNVINYKSIYCNYPNVFKDFFTLNNSEKLSELNNASLYMYLYVSLSDDFFDRKELKKDYVYSLNLGHIFYDEAIKILYKLFGDNKAFWEIWNLRRENFLNTNLFKNKIGFSFKDYIELAKHKSEIGKLAIDSLYLLSTNTTIIYYEKILKSHDLFSIGFQLLDDVQDFSIDLKESNTTNFILNEMIKDKIDINNYDNVKEQYFKYKYLINTLEISIDYFDKAIKEVNNSDSLFNQIITIKKNKASLYLNEIKTKYVR